MESCCIPVVTLTSYALCSGGLHGSENYSWSANMYVWIWVSMSCVVCCIIEFVIVEGRKVEECFSVWGMFELSSIHKPKPIGLERPGRSIIRLCCLGCGNPLHDQDVVLEGHVRMHGVLDGLDTPHPPHARPTQGLQTIFFYDREIPNTWWISDHSFVLTRLRQSFANRWKSPVGVLWNSSCFVFLDAWKDFQLLELERFCFQSTCCLGCGHPFHMSF